MGIDGVDRIDIGWVTARLLGTPAMNGKAPLTVHLPERRGIKFCLAGYYYRLTCDNCQANRKEAAMSKELMEYFNTRPRLGTLSTADRKGKVDVAYFGSAQMTDEKTVVVGLGHNRSFANLRENPYAVFMIMQPGEDPASWKGVRVYLEMIQYWDSGRQLDEIRARFAKKMGQRAARKMINACVQFQVYEIRPFADFGQTWRKSIGAE